MTLRARTAAAAVAAVLVLSLVAPAAGAAPTPTPTPGAETPPSGPHIVAVYPNPVADGDAGEFVVVDPAGAEGLTLADGEGRVSVPAADEPVALSPDPGAAGDLTDRRTVAADLALSNAGERLQLRRAGRPVDTLAYEDAPTAERHTREGWRPFGFTPREPRAYGRANATAFVLPDAPSVPTETLRAADDRLLVAGYTVTSTRVADALVAAARRNVTVRVLVEGGPVGGLPRREATVLDRLTRHGVAVRVVDGPRARFAFHHPKYAVVDDRALVLTENWTPSGTGGRDNRGWGVRVASEPVADDLAGLFARDFGAHDAREWTRVRRNQTFTQTAAATGSYPSRVGPERVRPREVRVLTAPGNAEGAVVGVVDDADRRVDVIGPSLGGLDTPLVRSLFRAAGRGVRVRVLLSGAWYVAEENRALAERMNDRAERRGLSLSARVAEPNGRYGSVHAKGVVADDVALVGSLNWNADSARENREVVLALSGGGAADYYRAVFAADWRGGRQTPPAGLALVAAVAVGLALAVLRRRVRFG